MYNRHRVIHIAVTDDEWQPYSKGREEHFTAQSFFAMGIVEYNVFLAIGTF